MIPPQSDQSVAPSAGAGHASVGYIPRVHDSDIRPLRRKNGQAQEMRVAAALPQHVSEEDFSAYP
jgi:pyrroloquinoline quinone (PQQ) biosynthesis protein C